MKKLFYVLLLLPVPALLLPSCNYFADESVAAQPAAVTTCDPDVDFRQYQTFAISDSIGYLQVQNGALKIVKKKNGETQFIVDAIARKLDRYCCYTQVYQTQKPELIVDVFMVDMVTAPVDYTDWWMHWDYWQRAGYAFVDEFYPHYSAGAVRRFAAGTLIIDMKDLLNAVPADFGYSARNIWTGAVSGLYAGTPSDEAINSALTECFEQTPSPSFKEDEDYR